MPRASVSTATAVKPGFFSNWRKAKRRSFITQRLHRIDSSRTPHGQPASQQSNGHTEQCHAAKRRRIGRHYAEEECGEDPREHEGRNYADEKARRDESQALVQH